LDLWQHCRDGGPPEFSTCGRLITKISRISLSRLLNKFTERLKLNLKLENNTCADFSDWCFFGIDQPKTLEEQQAQGADSKHFKRSKIF